MRREDRLNGLAQLAAIVGGLPVRCVGTADHVTSYAAALGPEGPERSAVLVASSSREAQRLIETLSPSVSAVWLLWPRAVSTPVGRAAERAGLAPLARFGVVGDVSSPTHLVRLDRGSTQRWFADSVRPAWGVRGGLARRVGALPLVAPWGFSGQALLLGRPGPPHRWPLTPPDGSGTPAVISLGGGATSGRSVLTYVDGDGELVRHVKVDPESRADSSCSSTRESQALATLGRMEALQGSVPQLLGCTREAGWQAFAQSHLPGVVLDRRWGPRQAREWERDVEAVVAWLCRLSSASADLPRSAMLTLARSSEPTLGLPAGLRAAISRGSRLAATTARVVHGDLWPANVVAGRDGIGVLDWESAALGHPLEDALSFVVTATRQRLPGSATLAEACTVALTGAGARQSEEWLRQVLATVGTPDLGQADLQDLVVSQLHELACRPAPGGAADARRTQDWMDGVRQVWERSGSESA